VAGPSPQPIEPAAISTVDRRTCVHVDTTDVGDRRLVEREFVGASVRELVERTTMALAHADESLECPAGDFSDGVDTTTCNGPTRTIEVICG
jgi:hypothetical protein